MIESLVNAPDMYGDMTPAIHITAALRRTNSKIDPSEASQLLQRLEQDPPMFAFGKTLTHAAFALAAERRGDSADAIKHYRLAMENRRGTSEQCYTEWIPERFVELLHSTGDIAGVIDALDRAIARRDTKLKPHHPERAYARIRLAQYLISNRMDLKQAGRLLSDAKAIYDHHGEYIPADQHRRIQSLMSQGQGNH